MSKSETRVETMKRYQASRSAVILSTIKWYLPDVLAGAVLFGAVFVFLPILLAMLH